MFALPPRPRRSAAAPAAPLVGRSPAARHVARLVDHVLRLEREEERRAEVVLLQQRPRPCPATSCRARASPSGRAPRRRFTRMRASAMAEDASARVSRPLRRALVRMSSVSVTSSSRCRSGVLLPPAGAAPPRPRRARVSARARLLGGGVVRSVGSRATRSAPRPARGAPPTRPSPPPRARRAAARRPAARPPAARPARASKVWGARSGAPSARASSSACRAGCRSTAPRLGGGSRSRRSESRQGGSARTWAECPHDRSAPTRRQPVEPKPPAPRAVAASPSVGDEGGRAPRAGRAAARCGRPARCGTARGRG